MNEPSRSKKLSLNNALTSSETSDQNQIDLDTAGMNQRDFEKNRKAQRNARETSGLKEKRLRETARLLQESFNKLERSAPGFFYLMDKSQVDGTPVSFIFGSYLNTDDTIMAMLRCAQAYGVKVHISSSPINL